MTDFPKTIKELQTALGFDGFDEEDFRMTVFELIRLGHVTYDNGYCLTPEGLKMVTKDNNEI